MAGHYKAASQMFQNEDNPVNGNLPPVPKAFNEPLVSGFMRPVRFEGEINNLEIEGTVPVGLHGTFYRVMPEPQFPSFIPNDPVRNQSPFWPLLNYLSPGSLSF